MYEIFLKLLEKKGVTAYKVGKETGIGASTFSDWKSGRSVPKQDKLQKIADFFGVTVDYLMTGEEKKELLKIDAKIKNGVNALLNGADIPELSKEIELLRIRKSELTDIINAAQSENKQVDPEKIKKILSSALNEIDNSENLKRLINTFVTKIYANPDGSATVHMGIRLSDEIMGYTQKNKPEIIGLKNSSGGTQPPLCENNIPEKTPNVNNEFFIIQTFIFNAA